MFPDKPAGCTIERREGPEGPVLSWPLLGGGRWASAGCLTFWLCGWTVGGLLAAGRFIVGTGSLFSDLFLLVWLGGWAVGECSALAALWQLTRAARPESVTLGRYTLCYDPGHSPMAASRQAGAA